MTDKYRRHSLLGRPRIGLALSGGGARGLAHIGVLKVLDREGIKVDALAGTSMGGLIAAAYAAGLSPEKMEVEALRMSQLRELVRLLEWFPPKGKLLDPNRIRRFLIEQLQLDVDFSELAKPLTVMAVDLSSTELVPINSGSVLKAVEATTALPGLFSPVEHAGRKLVDGGVLNNLPSDQLIKQGMDKVIAVDVGFHTGGFQPKQQVPILNLLPEVATEFYQVGALMMSHITEERLRRLPPDVLLRPELPAGSGILSGFVKPQAIINSGEQAAINALETIRDLTRSDVVEWLQSFGRRRARIS